MTRMIEQGQPQPQKYEKMGTVKKMGTQKLKKVPILHRDHDGIHQVRALQWWKSTFDPSLINVSPTSAVENWIQQIIKPGFTSLLQVVFPSSHPYFIFISQN